MFLRIRRQNRRRLMEGNLFAAQPKKATGQLVTGRSIVKQISPLQPADKNLARQKFDHGVRIHRQANIAWTGAALNRCDHFVSLKSDPI